MRLTNNNMDGVLSNVCTPLCPYIMCARQRHGISGLLSRDELVGIAADEESRAKRDVRGDRVAITFEIVDNRHPRKEKKLDLEDKKKKGEKRVTTSHGPYNVTVLLKVGHFLCGHWFLT